jgi:thiamine biosynthesis lipoprotein
VLSAINSSAGGNAVALDAETGALLDYADACWKQSGGLFDITSGVLRNVWDFKSERPPSAARVREVLRRIGWDRVRRDARSVALEPGMEIDFGGIGKEYAADRAMAVAIDCGIRHGFVNLGGDIRVIGPQPGGAPWRVGIVHPREVARTIAHLELGEGGLATSGDYERFFEFEGRRYCHVLDPRTGWPPERCPQSVSVVAPLCTVAGSCSTIAMLHGEGAEAYLSGQGLAYLLVGNDGSLARSDGARAMGSDTPPTPL